MFISEQTKPPPVLIRIFAKEKQTRNSILTASFELRDLLVARLLSSEFGLNRLLCEFWLSFFQRKGPLRYKAFLDSEKSLLPRSLFENSTSELVFSDRLLENPTAIRGHLHQPGLFV